MASARVRIRSAGARALLASGAVEGELLSLADGIAAACNASVSPDPMENPAFMAGSEPGGSRARARVWTSSPHGVHANNRNNTLLNHLRG